MIRWFEHRQVYAPSRTLQAKGSELGRPFEEVFLKAQDGVQLHGWFFPAEKASPRAHLVLLLLHGNAGNIGTRLHFYRAWLEMGVNVFAFDYRGFGQSEGKPSEEGTYRDAQAACQWLRGQGFAPEDIIVLGKSLGGGVASELGLREKVGALILQSTFTSIPDVGSEIFPWLPVRRLHRIKYDTVNKLPRIEVPVLVTHSREDDLIGFHHAERNFESANEPKMLWEIHGDHTSTLEDGREKYLQGLEKFISAHRPVRSTPKK
jgi:alpha-beta hydrolase superfamily lysophospholipase